MDIPTAQNKILVRRFEEAMKTRQLDALDEVVAPTFVLIVRRLRIWRFAAWRSSKIF
jgi:hypothetical protein